MVNTEAWQTSVQVKGFVKAPRKLVFDPGLAAMDIKIYLVLRSHLNEKKRNKVYPSKKRLGQMAKCSKNTVDRSIKALKKSSYITYHTGKKGWCNEYIFVDCMVPTMDRGDAMDGEGVAPPVGHQSEVGNKNNKQEASFPEKLFHGRDRAFIEQDQSITIVSQISGSRLEYSGGDDERFKFGSLRGREALKAAQKQAKGRCL